MDQLPQHVKCLVIWSHFLWSQTLPYQPYHVVWRSHGWWTWSFCRLDRQSMDQPPQHVKRLVFWSHYLDKERSDPTKCFLNFFFWEKRWTKMNKHFSQRGALPKNCSIFSTPDPWRDQLPQHVECLVSWSHFLWSQTLPYQVVWRSHGWWTWSSCRLDRQSMDQPPQGVKRLVFWSHYLDKERSDPTKCFWSFFFWEKRWTKMNKHFSQTGALPQKWSILSTPDPWWISFPSMWNA